MDRQVTALVPQRALLAPVLHSLGSRTSEQLRMPQLLQASSSYERLMIWHVLALTFN